MAKNYTNNHYGGLIVVAIMIDEKMQIIEEERNGRKEKLE